MNRLFSAQSFYENNKNIAKFHPSDERQVFAFAEAYAASDQMTLQQTRELLREKIRQAAHVKNAQLEKEIEALTIAIPLLMEENEK